MIGTRTLVSTARLTGLILDERFLDLAQFRGRNAKLLFSHAVLQLGQYIRTGSVSKKDLRCKNSKAIDKVLQGSKLIHNSTMKTHGAKDLFEVFGQCAGRLCVQPFLQEMVVVQQRQTALVRLDVVVQPHQAEGLEVMVVFEAEHLQQLNSIGDAAQNGA